MRGDRLKKNLERLHHTGQTDQDQRQALEVDLVHRYRNIHPRNRRWLMLLNPWNKTARFAIVGLAMMLLTVGACTTETSTQIEAGQRAHISLNMPDITADKSGDLETRLQDIEAFIDQYPGVDVHNANVRELIDDQGNVTTGLGLILWGDDLEADALQAALMDRFPELIDAEISFEPLATTITESIFDRLGRQVFHIQTEGASDEEIRAQILQQIAEDGFEGDAQVDVINEGDLQEIRVILEEDVDE